MADIKLSIIIPVYNAEKYLHQCLDSVLGQSLRDIEVICVDDGSTDSSGEILKEYAAGDSRVRVLRQQNKYAGAARNYGMSVARGEYLHFLDSDDYVLDYAYEAIYKMAAANNLDCLKFRSVPFDMQQNETIYNHIYMFTRLNRNDFNRLLRADADDALYHISVVPWNGIYRRAFLQKHDIQFNTLFCINDRSFCWRVITNAERIMLSKDRLVVHRVGQPGSLVGKRARHFDCQFQSIKITGSQLELDQIDPEVCRSVMQREFSDLQIWFRRFCGDKEYGPAILSDTEQFVRDYDGLCPELLAEAYDMALKHVSNGDNAPSSTKPERIFYDPCPSPKISVIIPVFNVQNYLHECLDSITKQTLPEIEIICVDDGSADASGTILKEYAAVDKRIRMIEQENLYAGAARNRGIREARGEYLLFLDADDFFDLSLCEKAWRKAKEEDADIVLFGAREYNTMTGKFAEKPNLFRRNLLPESPVFSRKEIPDTILALTTPNPWLKLFRKEFVLKENLRFQEIRHSNDIYFNLIALAVAGSVTYVNENLVNYRTGQTGNLQSRKDSDPTLFIDAYEAVYHELRRRRIFDEVEKSFADRMVCSCIHNLSTVKTEEAWLKIYHRLLDSCITKAGVLDHPGEYYNFPSNSDKLHSCSRISEWLAAFDAKKDDLRCLAADLWKGGDMALPVLTKASSVFDVYEVFFCYMEMQKLYQAEAFQYTKDDMSPDRLRQMLDYIKNAYMQLPYRERQISQVFPQGEKGFFRWYVTDECNALLGRQQAEKSKERLQKINNEKISELKNSKDYRLGWVILRVPRKMKKLLKQVVFRLRN
ncbi:MAG: glycosyltransferase [Lachnospiraceae bacterium]|nr:glycosyltransferase [Lachnospiraceae bacterium]